MISGRTVLTAIAVAGWICAAALTAWLVSRLGFLGIGLIGVTTWFVGSWLDLEKEGTVGHELTPGLYAEQIKAQQGLSRSERAALRSEQGLTRRTAQFFKYLGMGLTAIGLGGFLIHQL